MCGYSPKRPESPNDNANSPINVGSSNQSNTTLPSLSNGNSPSLGTGPNLTAAGIGQSAANDSGKRKGLTSLSLLYNSLIK